MINSMISL